MNCDSVASAIPLYYYGELAPELEEQIEDHCARCAGCGKELKQYQTLAAALGGAQAEIPSGLLGECRHQLFGALEERHAVEARSTWLDRLHETFGGLLHSTVRFKVPVGAMALIAIGYFGARLSPVLQRGPTEASLGSEPVISAVRSVQPDGDGRIQIAVDEVRRRTVSGQIDDRNIQRLLLAGVREEANDGVRVEAVDILKDRAGSAEVRAALLEAIAHDPNAGVRLKALEGLKAFGADAATRKTLAQVLLSDNNPGVRIQAIDLLMTHHDDSIVGLLQNVVQKENNNYVRMRCQTALRDMHASVGTF